jgi:hypothetical protein
LSRSNDAYLGSSRDFALERTAITGADASAQVDSSIRPTKEEVKFFEISSPYLCLRSYVSARPSQPILSIKFRNSNLFMSICTSHGTC